MVIRKLYRIESAHTVRNAVSERCSQNYHGHSGVIEVFLKSNHLDNAGMIYDFGAFKNTIGSLIDMFDHSVHLWRGDDPGCIKFFKEHSDGFEIADYDLSSRGAGDIFGTAQHGAGDFPLKNFSLKSLKIAQELLEQVKSKPEQFAHIIELGEEKFSKFSAKNVIFN